MSHAHAHSSPVPLNASSGAKPRRVRLKLCCFTRECCRYTSGRRNYSSRALDVPAAERGRSWPRPAGPTRASGRRVESLLSFHDEGASTRAAGRHGHQPRRDLRPGAGVRRPVSDDRAPRPRRHGRGVARRRPRARARRSRLKLIRSGDAEARARILNEVRLARQITHPAVVPCLRCRRSRRRSLLLDGAGRAARTWRRLIRARRAPALREGRRHRAAAVRRPAPRRHARRVLHRDLKPANVLIDERRVRCGSPISASRSRLDRAAGTRWSGTPDYMAPEQLLPGARADGAHRHLRARAGAATSCVVGQHGVQRSGTRGESAAPSTLAARCVNPELERVILQALSPDPRASPGVGGGRSPACRRRPAREPRARTSRAAARDGGSWQRASPRVVGRSRVIAHSVLPCRAAAIGADGARTPIVLADFANTTGEPVFDGSAEGGAGGGARAVAVPEGLSGRARARDAAADAAAARRARSRASIAREIAQREQLKALLAGSIAQPRHATTSSRSKRSTRETGDVMAREQVEAAGKEQVLTALGTAAPRLRGKLGESLASVQQFDVPLPRATTRVARGASRLFARARRQARSAAARSDSAPEARDRARPDFAHGACAAVRASMPTPASRRWRRSCRAGRSSCATASASASGSSSRGATTATPAQAWDKALELARVVDGDVSARGVRVQQPRRGVIYLRPVSIGRSNHFGKRCGSTRSSPPPISISRCVHGAQPLR